MVSNKAKQVLIIYRFLPQYRLEFYNLLKQSLNKKNIELQLIYGKTNKVDALRNDELDIEWADFIPNKIFKLWKIEILWQPCLKHIKGKDLIIVEQANKLVINYILMVWRHFAKFKFALWGHGRNLQIDKNSYRNKFKSFFLKKCDWYFAYTKYVKRFLIENKFPEHKITVVQNAIDTKSLRQYFDNITENDIIKLKQELNIKGSNIGLYCGAMYPDKRIGDIVKVCEFIKSKVPDFNMIFIGDGVDGYIAKEAALKHSWIKYIGPKFGNDKVIYFKTATIQIMPSAVGLGILDSFTLETPLITTYNPNHGPEIEYLENDFNGLILEDNLDIFSNKIVTIFQNKQYLNLIEGCKKSAKMYSVENMVDNFVEGIENCLKS